MEMLSPFAVQVAVTLLVVFSVGGIGIAALYPRLSGGSKSDKRLESVAATKRKPTDRVAALDDGRRKRNVEDTLKELEDAQKAKARKSKKLTLTMRMRQAGLSWSKRTYYLVCLGAAFATYAFALLVMGFGLLPAAGFAVSGGVILPNFYVNWKRKRRFKKFSNEFPNAVDVIVRGVKAGLPLIDCLKVIAREAQEPVRSEFQAIVEDQTLGMPISDAVARFPERIPLAETNFFAIVITIQARTGGSLAEALSNLSKVLRDRRKMDAKIRAMSAEAKSSAGIIGSLPIVVAILVYLTSPDYIMLLFQTTTGNIVLAGSALWMLMGIMVMRKMINFDF
ncbi:MAG: type II secretion system F family protein [Pseudomonadota bacterium]|nr:type II secretion system F family protein [Pseudomonadota bacterium]